jgi:hypothetical protein
VKLEILRHALLEAARPHLSQGRMTMARNPLTPFRFGGGLLGGSDPFLSLHRDVNRLFDDVLRGAGLPMAGAEAGGASPTSSIPR